MTSKIKQLAHEALCLSLKDRATLADTLLGSLDRPDPKIDALWKMETESRLRAFRTGKMQTIPLSRVLMNYR